MHSTTLQNAACSHKVMFRIISPKNFYSINSNVFQFRIPHLMTRFPCSETDTLPSISACPLEVKSLPPLAHETVGLGLPLGGRHCSTAVSPAVTEVSTGIRRKSSRRTGIYVYRKQ